MTFSFKTHHRHHFKKVMDEIDAINYDLTHPDSMAWGMMTIDECEASFLPDGFYYDDWGDKSMNILHYISESK